MFRLARQYRDDVPDGIDLFAWYERVRGLPYIFDPPGVESIARPGLVLDPRIPWRDCDDKTVAIMAWAEKYLVPYRVVVCGEYDRPHHVYAELKLAVGWVPVDATFPDAPGDRPQSERPSRFGLRQYHEGYAKRYYPEHSKKTGRGQ